MTSSGGWRRCGASRVLAGASAQQSQELRACAAHRQTGAALTRTLADPPPPSSLLRIHRQQEKLEDRVWLHLAD